MRRHEIANNRFLVFGAARSGLAAAKLLKRQGATVTIADERPRRQAEDLARELDAAQIPNIWGQSSSPLALLEGVTTLVLSPGIPTTHPLIAQATDSSLRVISEIELASAFVSPQAKVIAITGTNGKTTTASWTAHLLRQAGKNAVLAGNIGDAWSNSVDSPQNADADTVFVVEVSSFQLETIEDFHPNVALLTNLAPDHLDRYRDYSAYVEAKRNLLRNLQAQDDFVFNADNADSAGFARGCRARLWRFSRQGTGSLPGAYADDTELVLVSPDASPCRLLPRGELALPGEHNLENALAAALAAWLAGAAPEALAQGLRSFPGVEHRIELCGERFGVRFYNDSKATNLDSTEKALRAFEHPVVLIAGGRDKHGDYAQLKTLVRQRVRHLVTLGEAAPILERSWSDAVATERASSMDDAVRRAALAARPGDVVLLSPACASFDMYRDFEERGRDFKRCVQALVGRP